MSYAAWTVGCGLFSVSAIVLYKYSSIVQYSWSVATRCIPTLCITDRSAAGIRSKHWALLAGRTSARRQRQAAVASGNKRCLDTRKSGAFCCQNFCRRDEGLFRQEERKVSICSTVCSQLYPCSGQTAATVSRLQRKWESRWCGNDACSIHSRIGNIACS